MKVIGFIYAVVFAIFNFYLFPMQVENGRDAGRQLVENCQRVGADMQKCFCQANAFSHRYDPSIFDRFIFVTYFSDFEEKTTQKELRLSRNCPLGT